MSWFRWCTRSDNQRWFYRFYCDEQERDDVHYDLMVEYAYDGPYDIEVEQVNDEDVPLQAINNLIKQCDDVINYQQRLRTIMFKKLITRQLAEFDYG